MAGESRGFNEGFREGGDGVFSSRDLGVQPNPRGPESVDKFNRPAVGFPDKPAATGQSITSDRKIPDVTVPHRAPNITENTNATIRNASGGEGIDDPRQAQTPDAPDRTSTPTPSNQPDLPSGEPRTSGVPRGKTTEGRERQHPEDGPEYGTAYLNSLLERLRDPATADAAVQELRGPAGAAIYRLAIEDTGNPFHKTSSTRVGFFSEDDLSVEIFMADYTDPKTGISRPSSVGYLDFLPGRESDLKDGHMTRNSLSLIENLRKVFGQLDEGKAAPEYFYGRTNPRMANLTRRFGFSTEKMDTPSIIGDQYRVVGQTDVVRQRLEEVASKENARGETIIDILRKRLAGQSESGTET